MDIINLIGSFVKPKAPSKALKYYLAGSFAIGSAALVRNIKAFYKEDKEVIPFAFILWVASPIVAPYEIGYLFKDKIPFLKKFWDNSYYRKARNDFSSQKTLETLETNSMVHEEK